MVDIARKTAYDILFQVETKGSYADLILPGKVRNENIDSGFIRNLVYGVIEKKLYLDYILDTFIKHGIKSTDKKTLTILRMGIYQIEFMDSVPEYAGVDSAVEMAKTIVPGREKFINGVLRNFLRGRDDVKEPDNKSIIYSIDESIVKLWNGQLGEIESDRIMKALSEPAKLCVRVNLRRITSAEILKELSAVGISAEKSELSERNLIVSGLNPITDTWLYREGYISIQSCESTWISDEVVKMIRNTDEETEFAKNSTKGIKSREISILDACAAPGGKTAAIAEALPEAQIKAWDIYKNRVNLINKQKERLNLDNITAEAWDASKDRKEYHGMFDVVLVDAPCSGLGVMRRKPEIRYRDMSDEGKGIAKLQSEILNSTSAYVKDGGYIIYSTCTINRTENEDVIQSFLRSNDDFKIIYEKNLLPTEGYDGYYIAKLNRI